MTNTGPKNDNIDLSFIIVNYNLAEEIEDCLASLVELKQDYNYEVIIIDNNSPDRKIEDTEKKFKGNNISFYYMPDNLGFGKACNYGFTKASGEYICFLNPDTRIIEPFFQKIKHVFETEKNVGIVAPRQQLKSKYFDFSAGYFPNIFFELFSLVGLGVYFESFLTSTLTKIRKKDYFEMDWILGAAIFIKAELFKRLNGFDKDYFMFSEEVDLCKRTKMLGYKVIYYPAIRIYHIGSVSGRKDYTKFTIRTYSSKRIFITKHYSSIYKWTMISFLYMQLFTQLLIWLILFPRNKTKSKQKIEAFVFLIKNKLRME
jgi:O-antigen biosynthesis protein